MLVNSSVLIFFYIIYRKFLARLEKRLYFARYDIEKCYILHEMARAHYNQSHFDEACSVARKAIEGLNIYI